MPMPSGKLDSCGSNPIESQPIESQPIEHQPIALLTHFSTEKSLMCNDDLNEVVMSDTDNGYDCQITDDIMENQFPQPTFESNMSYIKESIQRMFKFMIEMKKQQDTFQKGLLATLADMKKAEIKTTNMLSRLNTKKRLPKCFEHRIPIASVEQFLEVERVLNESEEDIKDLVRLDLLDQICKILKLTLSTRI